MSPLQAQSRGTDRPCSPSDGGSTGALWAVLVPPSPCPFEDVSVTRCVPRARAAAIFSLTLRCHMRPERAPHLPWVLRGQASRPAQACQERLGGPVYPSKRTEVRTIGFVSLLPGNKICLGAQRGRGPQKHGPRPSPPKTESQKVRSLRYE